MYEVYLDGKILYYPGDKVNALSSAILDRKLDDSGRFDIKVPSTNPLFHNFQERKSEVLIKENGTEIWNGEVRSVQKNLKNEETVYVVGELSYLGCSSQPQKIYNDTTLLQMFSTVISIHNSMVEARKQFRVGIVAVDNAESITSWITNYEKTLDYIRAEMCSKLNAYLRIRRKDGVRYIDLVSLDNYGKSCEQPIEFGENLLDFTTNLTSDAIVSAIRPLGKKRDESKNEGVDEYTTIESVNGGKDYIENQDIINSGIGYVWETVYFESISDPAELKEAGETWLKDKQYSDMTIEVTSVDLSKLDAKIDGLELGDSVRTIARPYGMDKRSYITQKKVDLLNPTTKHNISIGEKIQHTYTQQASMIRGEILKRIPQQSSLLDLAKQNASALIKSATEGNIYFVNDDNGVPKELLIMDTADKDQAKKVWRWNLNGLGYSKTGYDGTFGLAMTMDGAIVADFITAGTMSCDRLNGGKIKGQHIEGGTINIGDTFSVKEGQVDISGAINVTEGGKIGDWVVANIGYTNTCGLQHLVKNETNGKYDGIAISPYGLYLLISDPEDSKFIFWEDLFRTVLGDNY